MTIAHNFLTNIFPFIEHDELWLALIVLFCILSFAGYFLIQKIGINKITETQTMPDERRFKKIIIVSGLFFCFLSPLVLFLLFHNRVSPDDVGIPNYILSIMIPLEVILIVTFGTLYIMGGRSKSSDDINKIHQKIFKTSFSFTAVVLLVVLLVLLVGPCLIGWRVAGCVSIFIVVASRIYRMIQIKKY